MHSSARCFQGWRTVELLSIGGMGGLLGGLRCFMVCRVIEDGGLCPGG